MYLSMRAVEDPAAVLPVVAGQVGPAAEQADAQGRLGDDHRAARRGPLLPGSPVRVGGADVAEVPLDQHRPGPAHQPRQQVVADVARRRPLISSSTLGWKAYMPALTRSETGSLGFSTNPMTLPAASSSTTPPADGLLGVEHRQGRDRAVLASARR